MPQKVALCLPPVRCVWTVLVALEERHGMLGHVRSTLGRGHTVRGQLCLLLLAE